MKKVSISELRNYRMRLVDKIEDAMKGSWLDDYTGREITEVMTIIGIISSALGALNNNSNNLITAVEIDDERIQAAIDIRSGNNHLVKAINDCQLSNGHLICLLEKHKICPSCGYRNKHKKGCLGHMSWQLNF